MNPAHETTAETVAALTGAMPGFDELGGYSSLQDLQGLIPKSAPEGQTKRPTSFVRYLVAIWLGIAGTLACQLYWEKPYGEKQIIVTSAPEQLGWSPDPKFARLGQLGWTKQSADFENAAMWLSAAETPQPRPVAQVITESLDETAQRQQMALSLAALRQTVEQIAGGQDKMASEIKRLASDVEMLAKTPAHPRPVASPRKPMPTPLPASPRSPRPLTLHP